MSHYFCLRETEDITAFIARAEPLPAETVSVGAALGRVLAQDVCAPQPCPADNRSTRDGYAVRSDDVAGASPHNPVLLHLAGESRMGTVCHAALHAGEAWRVYTGGPLPHCADAVVMQEDANPQHNPTRPPLIAISQPCAAGLRSFRAADA